MFHEEGKHIKGNRGVEVEPATGIPFTFFRFLPRKKGMLDTSKKVLKVKDFVLIYVWTPGRPHLTYYPCPLRHNPLFLRGEGDHPWLRATALDSYQAKKKTRQVTSVEYTSATRANSMNSSQANKGHHHGDKETRRFEDHIFPVTKTSYKPHTGPDY